MAEKCLLCKVNDVYHIKSHMTPAVITTNTFGARHKEEIVTIDAAEKTIDKYYGPEHSQKGNTDVKAAPNVRKGVFCKACENKLGDYEEAVQNKLVELINSIGKGVNVNRLGGVKYIDTGIHSNILITFFQSVVWRQCMEQIMDGKDTPIPADQLESLRKTVLNNIYIKPADIEDQELNVHQTMIALTTYHTDHPRTASFVNPHTANTIPRIFYIGPVVLLFWIKGKQTPGFTHYTAVDDDILKAEFLLSTGRLAIVNEGRWLKIHEKIADTVAGQFLAK